MREVLLSRLLDLEEDVLPMLERLWIAAPFQNGSDVA
jgi:hypothetical protein